MDDAQRSSWLFTYETFRLEEAWEMRRKMLFIRINCKHVALSEYVIRCYLWDGPDVWHGTEKNKKIYYLTNYYIVLLYAEAC